MLASLPATEATKSLITELGLAISKAVKELREQVAIAQQAANAHVRVQKAETKMQKTSLVLTALRQPYGKGLRRLAAGKADVMG